MATTGWRLGQSGLWTDPGAWSAGAPPDSSSDVVIASPPLAAGLAYTIALPGSAAVHAVSQTQAGACLAVSAGTLSIAGTYALAAGTLTLNHAALQGEAPVGRSASTLAGTGGGVVIDGAGTVSGIAVLGTLSIQGAVPGIYAQLGLLDDSFAGVGGHGAGALLLGPDIAAELGTGAVLNAVAVTLNSDTLEQAGGMLTIGATASVSATGLSVLGDANALTNSGCVTASGAGSVLAVDATALLNQGTLAVAGGANLLIQADSFDNAGLVSVGANSYLRVQTANASSFTDTGSITVSGGTLSLDTALTTAQLATLPVASGTLAVSGLLDNSGAILRSGAATGLANLLLEGGTITAGTIVNTGSFSVGAAPLAVGNPYDAPDSLLTGVTVDGVLNVAGAGAKLDIAGGLALNEVAGTGPGTLDVGGAGASITFVGAQAIDHLQVNLGSSAPQDYQTEQLLFQAPASGYATLTLGRHVAITQTGMDAGVGTTAYPGVIDLQGTLTAGMHGGLLTVSGCANAGLIAVSNGETLDISSSTNDGTISCSGAQLAIGGGVTNAGLIAVSGAPRAAGMPQDLTADGLTNTGVLSVSNGATASLGANWTNGGILAVSDGELLLGGSFTLAQLGVLRMSAGATLGLVGTLTTAGTLDVGAGGSIPSLMLSGTLAGGSLCDAGGAVQFVGTSTLDGVRYQGTLAIDRPFATVTVADGLTLTGAGGTQQGSLSLTGAGATLAWDSAQAFDHASVSIGAASAAYSAPAILAAQNDLKPVLLGTHLRVQQTGAAAAIGLSAGIYVSGATLTANVAHGQFTLGGSAFTNVGTIGIAGGDTVSASAAGFTNAGLIVIGTSSALDLNLYNYFASGTLADQSFINTGSITMAGGTLIELTGNGLFPKVPLLNTAGAHITGAGVVASQLDNNGLVEARGGTLNLVQTVAGTGALQVDTGATLVLGGVGHGQTVRFAGAGGVLGLQPAVFLGTIGGLAAGDTIDLFNTAGRSAAFSGSTLAVTLANGSTLALATTSALTGALNVSAGSHGDTLIRYCAMAEAFAVGCVSQPVAGRPQQSTSAWQAWPPTASEQNWTHHTQAA